MDFLFEDKENLANFIHCEDINTSGIPRFAISPLLTSTMIFCNSHGHTNELRYHELTSNVNDYVICSCVNHSPDDWTGYDPKVKSFFHHLNCFYCLD